MKPVVKTNELLNDLPRHRLADVARQYGIALPDDSRAKQVAHLTRTVDVKFGELLSRMTRDELRRACRKYDLDDSGRSRTELAEQLFGKFEGDVKEDIFLGIFAASKVDRAAPVVGDVILLRHRQWLVEDVVHPPQRNELSLIRAVCLDDDSQGQSIEAFWELELGAKVIQQEVGSLGTGIDEPRLFGAYLHALKWNSVTATDRELFQAPFRAGIMIQAHQLEPLRRALSLPRANLFIADDVGLGKTIEAGLVMQELILRQRVEFILISCPASVCLQWRDEMSKRFGLGFEVMSRAFVDRRRRERGFGVNPWSTHNRFIVSHDLLRRPEYREPLLNALGNRAKRSLFILDEAHVAAPSSAGKYATDSNITKVIRDVAPKFENRLFLSATPHNGHSNSFAALLELLDPQRFTRGVPVKDAKQRDAILVRRLKEDLRVLGRGSYPSRKLVRHGLHHNGTEWISSTQGDESPPIESSLGGGQVPFELQIAEALSNYKNLRLDKKSTGKLALINLQKRLLSSVPAFARTLKKHLDSRHGLTQLQEDLETENTKIESDDLYGDNIADEQVSFSKVAQASAELSPETSRSLSLLKEMGTLSHKYLNKPDAKILCLLSWIRDNQCPTAGITKAKDINSDWSETRVIIFTEATDTLRYIEQQLKREIAHTKDGHKRILTFYGGLGSDKRAEIQTAFNSPPDSHPVRILIANDAAREGVNLQGHCADLFHFDVPWNPAKMEQRNGRIDRTLQDAPEVRCHYFVYEDRKEDIVLEKLVNKVDTIKRELGSLGAVVMDRFEDQLNREGIYEDNAPQLEETEHDKKLGDVVNEELETARANQQELATNLIRVDEILNRSAKVTDYQPELLLDAINAGLALSNAEPLIPTPYNDIGIDAYTLPALPDSWASTVDSLRPPRGREEYFSDWRQREPLPVVFEPPPKMNSAVAQLHLSHPFVKRILSRFLSQGYSTHDLNRVTVVRSRDNLVRVIAFGRLSLFGRGATRLHDQLISIAARWVETSNEPLKPFAEEADRRALESLEQVLAESPSLAGIPDAAMRKVTEEAPLLFKGLWPHVKAEADAQAQNALLDLERRGTEEASQLEDILRLQKDAIVSQLNGQIEFDFEDLNINEKKQHEDDRKHMERRLVKLDREIIDEPDDLKNLYQVNLHRLQPVGLVVLWPRSRM